MTTKLKEAIARIQNLPDEQQDLVADMLLDAVRDRERISAGRSIQDKILAFKAYLKTRTVNVGLPLEATRRVNLYD